MKDYSLTAFFVIIFAYLTIVIFAAVSVGDVINKVQQQADESQFRNCVDDLVNYQKFTMKQALHECLSVYE